MLGTCVFWTLGLLRLRRFFELFLPHVLRFTNQSAASVAVLVKRVAVEF